MVAGALIFSSVSLPTPAIHSPTFEGCGSCPTVMTTTGIDTWNLISGAIVVLTVLPFIWAIVYNQHPETKLAHLDSTLKDTEVLLRSVVEEGLLHREQHVPHFESNLVMLRNKTEELREETFIASIEWRKLLQAWFNGLSRRIDTLCKQVKAIRANICETSADARIRLRQQHLDAALPIHRRWYAKVLEFWERVLYFARRCPAFETADALSSTTPTLPSPHDPVSEVGDAATTDAPENTTRLNDIPLPLPPLDKASIRSPNSESTRASSPVRPGVHDFHVLSRAIRRVDRELAAQGVTNTRLAQLVQATHRRWSPASSKAHRLPRRLRKQLGLTARSKHVLALQRASDPGIDIDSDGDWKETMCET